MVVLSERKIIGKGHPVKGVASCPYVTYKNIYNIHFFCKIAVSLAFTDIEGCFLHREGGQFLTPRGTVSHPKGDSFSPQRGQFLTRTPIYISPFQW